MIILFEMPPQELKKLENKEKRLLIPFNAWNSIILHKQNEFALKKYKMKRVLKLKNNLRLNKKRLKFKMFKNHNNWVVVTFWNINKIVFNEEKKLTSKCWLVDLELMKFLLYLRFYLEKKYEAEDKTTIVNWFGFLG